MANKEIAEITAGTAMDGTELLHGIQGGNSRKFTGLQLLTPTLTASQQASVRAASSASLKGHLFGLTISTNATDAANDIDIAAGEAASAQTAPVLMVFAGATGRQIDVAYGTGSGARFDTSISDGVWFIFLISNGTTTAVGLSKSADPTGQANYPGGYMHYRALGYVVRTSSVNNLPIMYGRKLDEVVGAAPVFGCRAWVNFNGTTGASSASGNISSVTRNGTGDYTLNFATAMPDTNYVLSGMATAANSGNSQTVINLVVATPGAGPILKSTTQCRIVTANASGGTPTDFSTVGIMVVR